MRNLVDFFLKKNILFKNLNEVDNKLLKIRNKIDIYKATDNKQNYHAVYIISQKSRFIMKNTEQLLSINNKLIRYLNHNFRYKHLIIKNEICSKSTELLITQGWKIHNDFV